MEIKKNGAAFQTIYTDADGKISLSALEPGSYAISSAPYTSGYDAFSGTFIVKEGDSSAKWDFTYKQVATGVLCVFANTAGTPIPCVRAALGCETPYQAEMALTW